MPRKKPVPKSLPYAGWTPMKGGVSQSLLQKFRVDKDRFHKHAVMGLREIDRKEAMIYGTIFHKLIELAAEMGDRYTLLKLKLAFQKYAKKSFPSNEDALLCKIALAQYSAYHDWHIARERYKYIAQEPVFCEPFQLPPLIFKPNPDISLRVPSGIVIPLRGRIDEVIERNGGMWIQENKTKSRINMSVLADTIHANIQVMFYAVCSELKYGRPCRGVIYNVIRKPGQRQKKKETELDFVNRIKEEIAADPTYYFRRLQVEFAPGQVQKWVREELLPLLYDVYFWWKSIESNPLNPWQDAEGNVNPFHGRKSFGIYDGMVDGKGDFYDLIVNNLTNNITTTKELFPELQDDE